MMRSSPRLLLRVLLALAAANLASSFSPTARPLSFRAMPSAVRNTLSSSNSMDVSSSAATNSNLMNGEHLSVVTSKQKNNNNKPSFATILWRFTRPHTIIGSAMAIPALHLLAAPSLAAAMSPATLFSMLYAMIPSLLMNLYITGLNQITDVEIDQINKPDLPIAAGLLRKSTAIGIVVASLVASLVMGACGGMYTTNGLNVALWGSAVLGTIYSLEPFRLKRFPVLAAFCIVAVRGAIINAGFFAHAQAAAFGVTGATVWGALTSDARCFWSSAFFAVFGIVIALMKDVPDVAGDEQSNIRTFSVRMGQVRVFKAMRQLLSLLFVGCSVAFAQRAVVATNAAVMAARIVTAVASLGFGWSVQQKAKDVDPKDSKQVYGFYMHLWKLFYGSYLVLPFCM